MGHWWTFATGVLAIVGFAVGFLLAVRANRQRHDGLDPTKEIEIRKLLASPYRPDGEVMSAVEISDRICQILDIDLVIPPATLPDRKAI